MNRENFGWAKRIITGEHEWVSEINNHINAVIFLLFKPQGAAVGINSLIPSKDQLKKFAELEHVTYDEIKTSEGTIPIVVIAESLIPKDIKYVKVFIGSQHNEYNGLFGIIEFLNLIGKSIISINELLKNNQILIFAPLMNPY